MKLNEGKVAEAIRFTGRRFAGTWVDSPWTVMVKTMESFWQ